MTEEQGAKLDNFFSDAHAHNIALYSQNASGITFRLGLMCFKIAMVLSAIRSDETEIICNEEDFNTAFKLVGEVYMPHAMAMLNKVGKQAIALTPAQIKLLTWIRTKEKFSRAEAAVKAKEIGVKERTLSDILKRFVMSKLIKKISHGLYTKR
jgi:DNA-binding MarR family transcriptional regulator